MTYSRRSFRFLLMMYPPPMPTITPSSSPKSYPRRPSSSHWGATMYLATPDPHSPLAFVSGTDDGKRPLEFARIHVAGFGVDTEPPRQFGEIVAPENLEARSVVEVRNHVLRKTAAEEQSPVVEPLGRGD